MKSKTLRDIKQFRRTLIVLFIYYVAYNVYFGFNMHPQSHAEKVCDSITQGLAGLSIGLLLSALTNFMELVVNFIKDQTECICNDIEKQTVKGYCRRCHSKE